MSVTLRALLELPELLMQERFLFVTPEKSWLVLILAAEH